MRNILICCLILISCKKNIKEIPSGNEAFYKIGQVNDNSEYFTTIKVLKESNNVQNNICNCITFVNGTDNNDVVTWYDCSSDRLQQHTMIDYETYSTCGYSPSVLSDKVTINISDSCCNILPLYITYFDVRYNAKNEKELTWVSENEENTSCYNVYKSTNAKDWEKLTTIVKSRNYYKYIDTQ